MNLMLKQQRQVKFLLSLSYLLYATIIADILGEMEFWSQPLQFYFPLNKQTHSGKNPKHPEETLFILLCKICSALVELSRILPLKKNIYFYL